MGERRYYRTSPRLIAYRRRIVSCLWTALHFCDLVLESWEGWIHPRSESSIFSTEFAFRWIIVFLEEDLQPKCQLYQKLVVLQLTQFISKGQSRCLNPQKHCAKWGNLTRFYIWKVFIGQCQMRLKHMVRKKTGLCGKIPKGGGGVWPKPTPHFSLFFQFRGL